MKVTINMTRLYHRKIKMYKSIIYIIIIIIIINKLFFPDIIQI